MTGKFKLATPTTADERPQYTLEDAKRDLQASSGTTFAYSIKMDLRIDQTTPKNGITKKKDTPSS